MKTDDEYVEIRLNATRTQNIKKQGTKRKSKRNNTLKLKNRKHTIRNRRNRNPNNQFTTRNSHIYGIKNIIWRKMANRNRIRHIKK